MIQSLSNETSVTWMANSGDGCVRNNATWKRSVETVKESNARPSSSQDVAQLYPQSIVAASDELAWPNIRLLHMQHHANELQLPPSDHHCIMLNLGVPVFLRCTYQRRSFTGQVDAGESAILPVGTTGLGQYQNPQAHDTLLLYLSPLFVRRIMDKLSMLHSGLLTPQIGYRCGHIRHIAMSLLGELNEASVLGRFYADSLATGLATQVLKHCSSLKDVHVGRGMAPYRLRKAVSLIEQHLDDEAEGRIALSTVARHVGMSYFHFSRAFKQAMGMTPTNYIIERRLERAKKLMQETDLPIADIALRSGFSSQSHFTTSFRRFVGVTPSSFRHAM